MSFSPRWLVWTQFFGLNLLAAHLSGVDLASLYRSFGAAPALGSILSVAEMSPGLRGIRAETHIEYGQLLIRVPINCCLICRRSPNDDIELSTLLLDTIADQDSSCPSWKAYSEHLPKKTGAAMLWEAEEIMELQAPQACRLAETLSARIKETGARLYDIREGLGEDDWTWAMSIIYSRSLVVNGRGFSYRALVPFVDMFNHQPESPVEYAEKWRALDFEDTLDSPWYLTDDDCIELRADAPARRGSELRIPYGIETTAELLTMSGFMPAQNSADYVSLFASPGDLVYSCSASLGLNKQQIRQRIVALMNIDAHEAPLAVRPGDLKASGHLIACMQLVVARDEELSNFEESYVGSVGHYTLVPSSKLSAERAAATEAAATTECARVAEELLEDFPTTVAEDEEHLRKCELANKQSESRIVVALKYRLGVKRMLTKFVSQCKEVRERVAHRLY
eukprot:CAMPEP_0119300166 /NCGR_PEP_ID=MMETSP1333-20130426/2158_1 /TAXON_ID=418940 /ORGANISM="Scyphosphaera apsteinii, Strain RCC1455" /LENGTH=451 /DNA_ID=CAMNT_0007301847 /DNA_START=182 /DNA_END=1537 /DNA_ORIENTATION=-